MRYYSPVHCLTCNYDLSNLTEHRCPECGRDFDPANAGTFIGDDWYKLRTRTLERWIYGCAFFPFTAIVAFAFLIALLGGFESYSNAATKFAAIVGFVVLALIPISVLVTIVLLATSLALIWRGGWTMRCRIFKHAGLVIGIWFASIVAIACLLSMMGM